MIYRTFIVYKVNLREKGKNMITFISPAKGFNETSPSPKQMPIQIEKSKIIINSLKDMDLEELSKIMKIKESLASLNVERFKDFKFDENGLFALFAYSGIQYKNIDPTSLSKDDLDYLDKHLRIISGLYGCLRPSDSIYPYRLEMLTKLPLKCNRISYKNLYAFWADSIYKNLEENSDGVIVNLASNEYSKAIKKHLKKDIIFVTCTFKVMKKGKLKVESTASKSARGKMLRYIAKNKISDYRELMNFTEDGYVFRKELSKIEENEVELIFTKNNI